MKGYLRKRGECWVAILLSWDKAREVARWSLLVNDAERATGESIDPGLAEAAARNAMAKALREMGEVA